MNKAQRGKLHRAINGISPQDVAGIVKQSFPRAKGGKIDQLAKAVLSRTHTGSHLRAKPRAANTGSKIREPHR
jgi:hypothetical protein